MRYSTSEKLEIIRTVETSHPAGQTDPRQDRHPQDDLLVLRESASVLIPKLGFPIATAAATRLARTGPRSRHHLGRACRGAGFWSRERHLPNFQCG
jgi:hypothetical protein